VENAGTQEERINRLLKEMDAGFERLESLF
jgi:hypothetical protein